VNTADEAVKLRKTGAVVEIRVQGHRTVALGADHFGQTGTTGCLYRHFGTEAATFAASAKDLTTAARQLGRTYCLSCLRITMVEV
jgi:pyruvate dehydrogenase complex dehydrogenase (E1) component